MEIKIRKEWGNFTEYHPFMDYNTGFWATNLTYYYEMFMTDKIPFVALQWTSDDNGTYFSMLANPCGYVVVELISDTIKSEYKDKFTNTTQMRFSFNNRNARPDSNHLTHYLSPIKISRATNRMKDVKNYYSRDIGVSMLTNESYSDFSEVAIFMYD